MDAFTRLFFNQGSIADFDQAWKSNPRLLTQLLFYLRDRRGGEARREFFRRAFIYLARLEPQLYALLPTIPRYGSWKDLVEIATADPLVVPIVALMFVERFKHDIMLMLKGKRISTAAKWFPSERSIGGQSTLRAEVLRLLGTNSAGLRRTYLSPLRHYLDLVEIKMSKGDWSAINTMMLPRQASKRYQNALLRREPNSRFAVPEPRSLVEIVGNILIGNTLKADEHWFRKMRAVTARGLTVVCDPRAGARAIALALAIGSEPYGAGIFTYEERPQAVTFPVNALLCYKVGKLKELSFDVQTTLSDLNADGIIVISYDNLPAELQKINDKRLIWWRPCDKIDLKRYSENVVEICGSSEKIFTALIKGYVPDFVTIVTSSLKHYPNCSVV